MNKLQLQCMTSSLIAMNTGSVTYFEIVSAATVNTQSNKPLKNSSSTNVLFSPV